MTSINNLAADIYTITNRPDMVNETILAIRSATLKAHHSDFYYKDVLEIGVAFDTPEYTQAFEPKMLNPNYRAMKYLRKYDTQYQCAGMLLTRKELNDIFDSYSIEYVNIYYGAGTQIQIKMNTQEQYLLFGCYIHPDVTIAGYSSWIADEYPFVIIYEAAATLFKMLGDINASNAYGGLAQAEVVLMATSNILVEGS